MLNMGKSMYIFYLCVLCQIECAICAYNASECICNSYALCMRVFAWQVDYDGRCAMHIACKEGNHKVVEMLIQNDADFNIKDRWGQTPLQVAISAKQQMIIGLLMASKAKLGIDDPGSALCAAAGDGDLAKR